MSSCRSDRRRQGRPDIDRHPIARITVGIDTLLYRDMFTPTTIESATISAHDLERICPTLAAQPDAGRRVLQALTFDEPTPASLDRAVKDLAVQRNPVSDQLWNSWERIVPSSRPGTPEQYYRRGAPAA